MPSCRFDSYSLADLKQLVVEHRCPQDTHADCPDYNNFSRFLNYAPSKEALIAKVGPRQLQQPGAKEVQNLKLEKLQGSARHCRSGGHWRP